MLTKEKINAIHELLEKEIVTTDEYVFILNVLDAKNGAIEKPKVAKGISIDRVIDVVADYFDLSAGDVKSKERSSELTLARRYIAYLGRTVVGATYKEIAEALGNRDYSTIMYGEKLVHAGIKEKEEIGNQIVAIKKLMEQ